MENITELSCPMYTTCVLCKERKLTKYFVRSIKNGRKFKRALYCNSCRSTYTDTVISLLITSIRETESGMRSTDPDLLTAHEILAKRKHAQWHIPLEIAKRYLEEGAAYFYTNDPTKIYFYFSDRKQLREYVLNRDLHNCCICGQTADYVRKKVPKNKGGLSTPDNMISVCRVHRFCSAVSVRKEDYALPIYMANSSDIIDGLSNPSAHTLKLYHNPKKIYVYCDISTARGSTIYGVSNVITGGPLKGIHVYMSTIEDKPNQQHRAELRAIQEAIRIIHKNEWSGYRVIVFTDVAYGNILFSEGRNGQLAKKIEANRGKIAIRTLTNVEQSKNQLYSLAHRYSRKAIKDRYC